MPGMKPKPRTVSGSYRGKSQPRRKAAKKAAKPAKGLFKAMKGTQYGTKPWN